MPIVPGPGRDGAVTRLETCLIVSLRYMGDVLLATSLARSIRAAVPNAAVDFLVFRGTEGILAGHPDIRRVITVDPGTRRLRDVLGRFRRYDVSIGVNASDRTAFQVAASGRKSIGFVEPRPKEWWKRALFSHASVYDTERHVVELLLGQLKFLDIPPVPDIRMHFTGADREAARAAAGPGDFVLFHPYTRWEYKKWPSRNWADLCRRVEKGTGIRVLFTEAPGVFEGRIREEILAAGMGDHRFVPSMPSLSQLAALVSLAKCLVSVDTVVAHMSAALGIRTVAIFGPTPPHRWGPWPKGHPVSPPFGSRGGIQRNGNVVIVQKAWDCAACDRMGCDDRPDASSRCLLELPPDLVYNEVLRRIVCPEAR
jgi:heptosyltransferase III